ncbi:hypothetical protein H0B56_07070 [Haloechinothrix sp. YIM 98757]|uniref:Uncharacterized protein n=1 Tax=Haloechinothrix aidingensis TaxID=2752311 RepID=A0A838A663_9PSEU|nr:hypothetical protein [Haloechinothrix aidingensis]MBA0125300.1 hypothetical protein [Haloechinothrix aidingensis]
MSATVHPHLAEPASAHLVDEAAELVEGVPVAGAGPCPDEDHIVLGYD